MEFMEKALSLFFSPVTIFLHIWDVLEANDDDPAIIFVAILWICGLALSLYTYFMGARLAFMVVAGVIAIVMNVFFYLKFKSGELEHTVWSAIFAGFFCGYAAGYYVIGALLLLAIRPYPM